MKNETKRTKQFFEPPKAVEVYEKVTRMRVC